MQASYSNDSSQEFGTDTYSPNVINVVGSVERVDTGSILGSLALDAELEHVAVLAYD